MEVRICVTLLAKESPMFMMSFSMDVLPQPSFVVSKEDAINAREEKVRR